MNNDIDIAVRSPNAFVLAREALLIMEQHGVWPTPLNYEIWLYVAGDPNGELAIEINRLIDTGQQITEDVSETLAGKFITRLQFTEEVRDAGARMTQELAAISDVISEAQKSQKSYSKTLEGARVSIIESETDAASMMALVDKLTKATKMVLNHHEKLETRLNESSREVSRLRQHLEQVRLESMTDVLTNLANRKAFDEQLERYCVNPNEPSPLIMAVVDIDHFKRFNDTWGHQTGDQVLRYVASVLGRVGREPRLAARYGGEEFVLLFPNESIELVHSIIDEARQEISTRLLKRRSTNEELGTISISVGLAQRGINEDSFSFMDRADTALYSSKNNGRNLVSCAPPFGSKAVSAA